MEDIESLAQIDYLSFTITLFIIMFGVKQAIEIFSYYKKKFRLKTGDDVDKENLEKRLSKLEEHDRWQYDAILKLTAGATEKEKALKEHSDEMKEFNSRMDSIIAELQTQYDAIINKIDNQQTNLNKINEDSQRRDCAILRDRILGGMRYFSQNKDEEGIVHISLTDHENMGHMFEEYFDCHGNGTIKSMYDNEFKKFIIDN